jgi:hypothetical protein
MSERATEPQSIGDMFTESPGAVVKRISIKRLRTIQTGLSLSISREMPLILLLLLYWHNTMNMIDMSLLP